MSVTQAAEPLGVSRLAKTILALSIAISVLAFALIVEFGVNAGRIHYGVKLGGVSFGGLTETEAEHRLDAMKTTPIVFERDPLGPLSFVPARLGWVPGAALVAEAMAVGRSGGVIGALSDRVSAWFGGLDAGDLPAPDPKKVGILINQWEKHAEKAGMRIDRAKLRFKLRRTIRSWPRKASYRIPLTTASP